MRIATRVSSSIPMERITVIGAGYVGLTFALVFAQSGDTVTVVDTNESVIRNLKRGISHVHEPGIESLLKRHVGKRIFFDTRLSDDSTVYVICVGTPVRAQGSVDMKFLRSSLVQLSRVLKREDLVVLRSTVPVGTCRNVVAPLLQKHSGLSAGEDFSLAFAPERTVEGDALNELPNLPQVIGGLNEVSADRTMNLFEGVVPSLVLVPDVESAEMVKLLNNSFRDLTFAFANEAALLCGAYGIDTHKVIYAANYGYTRSRIPLPSPGVGGACLVKDPYILEWSGMQAGVPLRLPRMGRVVNESMIQNVCEVVAAFCRSRKLSPKQVNIFAVGLAFKGVPETRDLRFSTSVDIIRRLAKTFPNIVVYDPVVSKRESAAVLPQRFCEPQRGFRGAQIVLLLNNHPTYRHWDYPSYLAAMKKPGLFFDTWRVLGEARDFAVAPGIVYRGL